MKPRLVDIHSHILPYTDDGADDWESSLTMLKNAAAEGIIAIVATPHVLNENDFKAEQQIIDVYNDLCSKAKEAKIAIKIYLASEIYFQPDTSLEHQIATLNDNNKYFLIEFPMNSIPRFAPEKFFNFILDNYVPIVAHPERNIGFQKKPDLVYDYVQRGALMQINEGSLRGRYGELAKILALKMIENNLAHFIASDGHKPNSRTVTLIESYKLIVDNYGKKTADKLFYSNPLKAINGEPIISDSPLPIEGELKLKFWQRLKLFRKKV